ncbi:(d)CMP kinase [Alloacidobacterium dinghuense]|uniref:Cytidylate kinase n=1 Tax=Alloacidobacterium dinghuense TaxID=2763107 RepID=A0A7G8BEV8_9BACT|nr:(d)CMP kinase [Alloacidobacterium dinghuense]QNI31078.1 (d)CMP kinase [Alloacidobacterium dinghuense]
MIGRRLIVAIDGPAGAGKSTVAGKLAADFGLLNLETGAMYRAFALKAIENGVPSDDAAALEKLAAETSIGLEATPAGNRVLLDGSDVTARVRDAAVTQAASQVSVHPAIRSWMVDLQRKLGEKGGVVMEGRDIGTVVFPDADIKIFLDASPEARGERRFEQSGKVTTQESILKEIRERDQRDRNRAQSPLRPAPDAVVIDSTDLTLEEVVNKVQDLITARLVLQAQ